MTVTHRGVPSFQLLANVPFPSNEAETGAVSGWAAAHKRPFLDRTLHAEEVSYCPGTCSRIAVNYRPLHIRRHPSRHRRHDHDGVLQYESSCHHVCQSIYAYPCICTSVFPHCTDTYGMSSHYPSPRERERERERERHYTAHTHTHTYTHPPTKTHPPTHPPTHTHTH